MPYIELDGNNLFYTASTKRSSEISLLLVHGAGGSHLTWPAELRRFPGVDVYALDLPGHGRSDQPGRRSVEQYAHVAVQFIDRLELPSVVFFGHSMGGAIGITVALNSPSAIVGLALVGSGARLRVTDAILDSVVADYEAAVQTITKMSWAADAPRELVGAGSDLLRQQCPAVVHGDYLACNQFDVMERLGEIDVPTLVISGTHDQLTPVKYGRYLAHRIPGAHHVTVEGGGHMMALEHGAEVAEALSGFLTGLKMSGPSR
jgi:pimeloyl-ACP methyl ester carboxylesterase